MKGYEYEYLRLLYTDEELENMTEEEMEEIVREMDRNNDDCRDDFF